MSKNTLFNYFSKSPGTPSSKVKESPKRVETKTPKRSAQREVVTPKNVKDSSKKPKLNKSSTKKTIEKRRQKHEESDEDEDIQLPKKKKRRLALEEISDDEEDSGDEYIPDKKATVESETESEDSVEESDEDSFINDDSDGESPMNKVSKSKPKSIKSNRKLNGKKSFVSNVEKSNKEIIKGVVDHDNWPHLKLEFLKSDKIRDANRKSPSEPNYNPRTLFVPEDFKQKLTPAVRQWWELKSQHYDCILFFKVGKFYEMYHMDAVTAAKELNLLYMKGDFAHVGFPESAYGRFSAILVEKGYKVARIEQTETPDMMLERCKTLKKTTKFDKVVRREICRITTKGTRTFGVIDGETNDPENSFLIALSEKELSPSSSMYGVCFIDTSIGLFYLGQFEDDCHCSRLRTLCAHYPPVQILFERNKLSPHTKKVIDTMLSSAIKEALIPEVEFWSSSKTLVTLTEGDYFKKDNNTVYPEKLKEFLGCDSDFQLNANDACDLGIKSLGAVIWYLKQCKFDYQLLTRGRFEIFKPVDIECINIYNHDDIKIKHMILDAITLKNLHIIENSIGSCAGTLLNKLNHCSTPFGKRLLYQWLCNPLTDISNIKARQNAISSLMIIPDLVREIRSELSTLPDLERLFSRIYSQSCNGVESDHAETRAIYFEEKIYSKRKIIDFISILKGFRTSMKIMKILQSENIESNDSECNLLTKICNHPSSVHPGIYPNLTELLDNFENSFDHNEAMKHGRIFPEPGMDEQYDAVLEKIHNLEADLKCYLKEQCKHFGCNVVYFGTDKKRYQLEVPEVASKRAGDEYELQSQRKGFKRYTTNYTKKFLDQMISYEEEKIDVLKNLRERIFTRFCDKFEDWNNAIQCLATLDVFISLAEYCRCEEQTMCIPKFYPALLNKKPFVELIDGRYPCGTSEENFIPNDIIISKENNNLWNSSLILVTGPNMGGKSTLMRQLGIITIMAHMGCYVPAKRFELNPVDRIFTRIGANDNIIAGESTFFVELCETSAILHHASRFSLVLVDELGRGTSTYDGTAIASAVVKELVQKQCRTLFSTHYHSLVEDFKTNLLVALGHMACMVENDETNDTDTDKDLETITFLYKFANGACPKSYGFNAARLAGMPSEIIKLGLCRAKEFETVAKRRILFNTLFSSDDPTAVKNAILAL
ncbi:DNA mismatch repair protein Msh6 [Daktulosphaira vitifoliae]|uniref:DNA mismatch repair protein Msh6 n=1 Tax=Daktulosphaira vitifoliae TaxID=58002 RepID=UPI0021A9E6C5|nr:DNA mismatch repair protein Msh6 [Daktulosphaira vitifoliae]